MFETLQTTTFDVGGMCCSDEEILIRKKLDALSEVRQFTFNLISQKLTVRHTCPKEEIVSALHDAGFQAKTDISHIESSTFGGFWQKQSALIFTSTSALLTIAGIIMEYLGASTQVSIPVSLAAILSGGWKIAWRGFKAVKNLTLDMNFLMTIATIGAMIIGEWAEAAAVIVLFSIALLLESYSLERTRKAVRSLMTITPTRATVSRKSGIEQNVPIEQVAIGDVMVIRPGEYIPLDGEIINGYSSVNQSAITGESLPVEKKTGDVVYAGTLNQRGSFDVRVTKLAPDTMLARIMNLIEEAQAQRAPSQSFVERFAAYYTPIVIGIASFIAIIPPLLFAEPFDEWFYRALVLLVIACPCALVISTPITIVSGLTNAARQGVLLKGGRYLEEMGRIRAIAFDKTGTLTEGTPRVTDVIPLNFILSEVEGPKQIIQLAAAIEAKSEHHLANAILTKAYQENVVIDNVTYQHFEALMGLGITATVDGVMYCIGNHALIEEKGICTPEVEAVLKKLESEGKTAIILGTEKEALGIIAIADEVRLDAAHTVQTLHTEGIKKVIMLTGDNEGTARAIAEKTGIDEFYAGILPDEKVNRIKTLKERYGRVAMVGDGINDAPALAASDIGIAMGTAGTDATLETANVVLMSDDLPKLSYLIALSKKTLSVIRQNITIALTTKLIFLVLSISGAATLWMAVLADDGAALIVILNALRVLRFRE